MGKQKTKIKRLAALWLSIAMLFGSIYTSSDYSSLADQTGLNILESFKAENSKSSEGSHGSNSITAVKATAANSNTSNELQDGVDIENDLVTASGSDTIDGDIATASNANAIRALTSNVREIVRDEIKSTMEYVNSISGSIENASDFAIGKVGTNHLMLRCTIDVKNDFPLDKTDDIGAEIIIPKGFKITNFDVPEDELGWKGEYVLNDNTDAYSGGIIKLQCQAHLTDKLIVTFEIFQNAQIIINNLSTAHIINFPLNLYVDYSTNSPSLLVASSGDERTTELLLQEADNSDPTWTVTVERNGLTLKPSYFSSSGMDASENAYRTYSSLYSSAFNEGLVVKYTKTRGYIADNTLFKFMAEKLPLYNNTYTVAVRYTDEYGNVLNLSGSNLNYGTTATNGQFKLMAAQKANTFTAVAGATPQNSTYADIFYNAGAFEIRVIPNILYNKIYYNTANVFPLEYESDYQTSVETISNNTEGANVSAEGEKIKIIISDGSEDASEIRVKSASAADSELLEVYQTGTTKTYNDIEEQYIRLNYEQSGTANWTPYNNFSLTVEYAEVSGNYPEALTPVKLEELKTSSDFGLTYKIHIKDAKTNKERIETIVGWKNSSEYYDYTIADPSIEKIVGRGSTTWDGTKSLSKTEYVNKIEIVKDRVTSSKVRSSCSLAKTILRAQHYTIDEQNTNIPDKTEVELRATVNIANVTWGPYVQKILTIENLDKMGDTLELLEADAQLEMAVNNATAESGILGTYTLKKYPLTEVDENDLPVVVLSGDGITLTDRVSATGQTLLYVVYTNEDGERDEIDLTDRSNNRCNKLASDYIFETTSSYKDSIKYNREYVLNKFKNLPCGALENPYRLNGNAGDTDTKLYNLTKLFEDFEISYASEIVLRQDFVKDWQPTNMEGETWSKCFYVNAIKPGYLNYDNLVKINSNPDKGEVNLDSVQLTYTSKLYCRASDWINKKATCSDSEKHGEQTKKEQNITKIVYGNIVRDFAIDQWAWNVDECNTFGQAPGVTGYTSRQGTYAYSLVQIAPGINNGRWITPIRFGETQIDYDNVEYDFSGTSDELLSLVSGVALDFNDDYSMFLIDIEYTTSDGKEHLLSNCLFDIGVVTSGTNSDVFQGHVNLDIAEGTYLTGLKIKISNEGYIWCNERYNGGKNMQPQFPAVNLYRNDKTSMMPKTYPSDSTKKIGYQGNPDGAGATYDQHNVKCTVTYTDIFNKAMDPIVIEGDSSRISNTKISVSSSSVNAISYQLADDASSGVIRRGDLLNVSLVDSIGFSPSNKEVEFRPVFYYAIDKNFTPDTSHIKGLEEGTKAFFYPAGIGDGYSGSEDYGYLVIDYKDTLESQLPLALGNATSGTRKYVEHIVPLDVNFDAELGDKIPILFKWTDLPYDLKRNGSSGNSEAEIEFPSYYAKATAKYKNNSLTTTVPVITDREGNPISDLEKTPKMLFTDLTSMSSNSLIVHELNMWGVVPYVTETAFGNRNQKSVTSRDYRALDKNDGLFGNIIYVVGNSENNIEDFDIYLPIAKEGDTNKNALGEQTDEAEFGLDFYTIDVEELETVAENVSVSYTTDPNPGLDGYDSMSIASWKEATPSDLSSITGIRVHMKTLEAGATEPIRIQYKLSKDKDVTGTQTAYQTFYYRFSLAGEYKTTTTPTVEKYILEDMAITGFVWDETGYEPNSVYDKETDKLKSGVTLGLYKKDGITLVEQPSDDKMSKTAEDGKYTLLTPVDGEYIVKIATPIDAEETWGLVIKEKVNDLSISSRANQNTGKTDVLKLVSNYLRDEYSLDDVNFGIYKLAKFEDMEDAIVHVGDKATASNIKLIGNTMSLGDDAKTKLGMPKDPSVVELEIASNSDSLVISAKGLKAGKTFAEVSCIDSYGNEIKNELNIYSYVRIKYDVTTNGGTGTASDANMYYIEETTNRLLSTSDALGASGSLIPNTFTANDGGGVVPPTGYMLVGWSTNKDATSETLEIQKGESYNIADNDTTSDILLYAIYGPIDVKYTIEYYRQISGQEAGIESSYEHYAGGDTIEGDTQATGVVGTVVKAPAGYESKFGNKYKFNASMSNEELQKTIAADGSTVVKLYYDIVKNNNSGGGGSGGGSSSTGKHAVNQVNADERNIDKNQTTLVEPKPDDNNYKNWVWGLMPKTGEEAAKMGALLLSIAGLVAILAALVARRKQKE